MMNRVGESFGATPTSRFESGDPRVSGGAQWRLPASELSRVVDFLAHFPLWRLPYLPPVTAGTVWQVLLRDPVSGAVLPDQWPVADVWSFIFLYLGGEPRGNFQLYFPFEQPHSEFLNYLKTILPYLPFRVAWSRFRLCIPNFGFTEYSYRKIDPAVFTQLRG
jgi:hypothetical protein